MKLKLNTLFGEEKDFQFEVTQEWMNTLFKSDVEKDSVDSEMYSVDGPMQMKVWVHRNDEDVFFRASLTGDVKCMCVRCLEKFVFPQSLDFQGIFIVPDHLSNKEPDDPFTYFFDGDEIDFTQPVRENVFLELPINPYCEMALDSCVGEPLQATNDEPEPTPESNVDPRWAALQQIKTSLKK